MILSPFFHVGGCQTSNNHNNNPISLFSYHFLHPPSFLLHWLPETTCLLHIHPPPPPCSLQKHDTYPISKLRTCNVLTKPTKIPVILTLSAYYSFFAFHVGCTIIIIAMHPSTTLALESIRRKKGEIMPISTIQDFLDCGSKGKRCGWS